MSIFFVPALLSLLFKLFVLAYVVRGAKVSLVFLSLIVVFALHNAIEFIGYLYLAEAPTAEILFRFYYVATVYVILYILLHALTVSNMANRILVSSLVVMATLLAGLSLFSDLIITGFYSIGYTVTAEKGSLYLAFAIYVLIALTGSFAVTFYHSRYAKSHMDSVRCLHSLIALTPMIIVCALAILFKIADIGINATGLIPIATAIFLAIVLKTEAKHKLSDLRRVMPLSRERETTNKLMDLLDDYIQNSDRTNAYKELQEHIEREIVLYSLAKCDGNITNTTKMMGLKNRSTLYSMLNRLGINLNELKLKTSD